MAWRWPIHSSRRISAKSSPSQRQGREPGLEDAEFSEDRVNRPPRGSSHNLVSAAPPPPTAPTWEPRAWSLPVTLEAP